MSDSINIDDILVELANSPASGSVDGQSFSSHNIKDLIALDRYLSSKKALSEGKAGIRIMKLKGGSVND